MANKSRPAQAVRRASVVAKTPLSLGVAALLSLALLAGCSPAQSPSVAASAAALQQTSAASTLPLPAPPTVAAQWLGRWLGPEGTFIDIEERAGRYTVTVQSLDASQSFTASPAKNGLYFKRDGVKEMLTATDGDATGMKWLAGKTHCLTVKPGEGYCRD